MEWLDEAFAALPAGLRRREFVELVALVIALPACKEKPSKPAPTPEPAGALDAATKRTLEAVAARILPGDATFPGARETNVVTFIDRQLAIAPMSKLVPAITALALALNEHGDFATLRGVRQDEIIEALSRGTLGTQLPERELFRVLHGFVLEGFLCDPKHGGNKDQLGWRAVGFPEPTLRTPGGHHHG
jgi:gluconate 2-dehydrogenase gamma chain